MVQRPLKNAAIWALAIGLTIFAMSTALPWAAHNGYAGKVIQQNVQQGRDASGIFYTDVPNMGELEKRFDRLESAGGVK